MLDISDFPKHSQFLEISRGTVSKVMTAYTQRSKTFFAKQNGGQTEKLSAGDIRMLKSIVRSKKRKTELKMTTKLNQHPDSPVSMITIRRHLHKQNIYGSAAILK
ncbi:hypothetical protein TNCV_2734671 [Trichonephila clavipes]|nr:hypothetical protein TNCV_2734671 [Trichonephila clavipes]